MKNYCLSKILFLLCLALTVTDAKSMQLVRKYWNEATHWYTRERLFAAAKHGDINKIESIIKSRMPVDVQHDYNRTPLMIAARYGQVEAIATLIKLGADVNKKDAFGHTALYYAANPFRWGIKWDQQINAIKELAHLGANINAKSSYGSYIIDEIAQIPEIPLQLIKILFELGAHPSENLWTEIEQRHPRLWGIREQYQAVSENDMERKIATIAQEDNPMTEKFNYINQINISPLQQVTPNATAINWGANLGGQ